MKDRQRPGDLPHTRSGAQVGSRRRSSLFATTLAIIVVQLFALGHSVLFQHTRCEHGALVHTLIGQARDAGVREAMPRDQVSSIRGGEASFEEHEHCDGLMTRPALVPLASPSGQVCILESLPLTTLAGRVGERAVAILALAPKTSPTAG